MNDTNLIFDKHSFSPPLYDDPNSFSKQLSHYISFGSLNIRGLRSSPNKLSSLLSDLHDKQLSVLALQETHLPARSGKFQLTNALSSLSLPQDSYTSHWCYDPNDHAGGVGLIFNKFIASYIQRFHNYKGRCISADLFLPAKKLKIIAIYCYPDSPQHRSLNKNLYNYVVKHISEANKQDFSCILLGDFNADPSKYFYHLDKGHPISPKYKLIDYLLTESYTEHSPTSEAGNKYATFYKPDNSPCSRVDHVWTPANLIQAFFFSEVWLPPSFHLSTDTTYILDHRCIINYFYKTLFIGHLPIHRIKQKKAWRTYYDVKAATPADWKDFQDIISANLKTSNSFSYDEIDDPTPVTLDANQINKKWDLIQGSILKAAKESINTKSVPPNAKWSLTDDEKLNNLNFYLSSITKIFSFLIMLCKRPRSSFFSQAIQNRWNGPVKSFRSELLEILYKYTPNGQTIPEIPTNVSINNRNAFITLKTTVAVFRNIIRKQRDSHTQLITRKLITQFENRRCDNFEFRKSDFITSALNRSKRSIVLDRAMKILPDGSEYLATDAEEVKQLAAAHFKTIAGLPPANVPLLDDFPEVWKTHYNPLQHVDSSIYQSLLEPVSDEELLRCINSLPNGKAAGLSGIPYEMLKHLPPSGLSQLKDLISLCLRSSQIPKDWKNATIYPIPKPHEWHCYLKNTRPICLLDTARKVMTRILYSRLSAILVQNRVLTGNNFAGLPENSVDPPIAIMEALLHDAKTYDKPLFILQQDISKAFDSMDIKMLKLAMLRLRIPNSFISLILELFTDRYNSVITAYGPSDPYKLQIGIDQGEVISPLLWVIYIDPLLTALNEHNSDPYTIDSNPSIPPTPIPTLGYMDDTNLVSASIDSLTKMLKLSQGFYELNNTKINFSKAIFICNRNPAASNLQLPSKPESFNFRLDNSSFSLTPIHYRDSFRFLGVWFSLSLSTQYVRKQCATEYKIFSRTLSKKKLTYDQLKYLHNSVLVPKVEYRLKGCLPSERDCNSIQATFRKTFKHSLDIALNLPNSFLSCSHTLGIFNLFHRLVSSHANRLYSIFQLDSSHILSGLLSHRIYSIQQSLFLPHSPMAIPEFSPFMECKATSNDLIFRTIAFASKFGLRFLPPFTSPANAHTPLYSLFNDNPKLFASSLIHLKRYNLQYLSSCLSPDGITLLPLTTIIANSSSLFPPRKSPRWFKYIANKIYISPQSRRILPIYTQAQVNLNLPISSTSYDSRFPLNTIPIPTSSSSRVSYWGATWNHLDNIPQFGRVLKSNKKYVVLQHWIVNNPNNPPNHNDLTPNSAPITLIECTGCHLHEPEAYHLSSTKKIRDSQCLAKLPHNLTVHLKHLQTGVFDRSIPYHKLASSLFLLTPQIVNTLFPRTPLSPHLQTPITTTSRNPIRLSFQSKDSALINIQNMTPRHILKHIHTASLFNEILSLARCEDILLLHHANSIDWQITFDAFSLNHRSSKMATSFIASKHISFVTKTFNKELPLLTNLQFRQPDVYPLDLRCLLCREETEDWRHLWNCYSLKYFIKKFHASSKSFLENLIIKVSEKPDFAFPDQWHNLACWTLPDVTPDINSPPTFTMDYFVRGLVPKSLTDLLRTWFSKQVTTLLMTEFLCHSVHSFKTTVWKQRCTLFAPLNKALIEHHAKAPSSTSSTHVNSSLPSTPFHRLRQYPSENLDERWKDWISRAISTGRLASWMDFHICINNFE